MHPEMSTPTPAGPASPSRRSRYGPEAIALLAIGLACVSALILAHYLFGP